MAPVCVCRQELSWFLGRFRRGQRLPRRRSLGCRRPGSQPDLHPPRRIGCAHRDCAWRLRRQCVQVANCPMDRRARRVRFSPADLPGGGRDRSGVIASPPREEPCAGRTVIRPAGNCRVCLRHCRRMGAARGRNCWNRLVDDLGRRGLCGDDRVGARERRDRQTDPCGLLRDGSRNRAGSWRVVCRFQRPADALLDCDSTRPRHPAPTAALAAQGCAGSCI